MKPRGMKPVNDGEPDYYLHSVCVCVCFIEGAAGSVNI